MNVCVCERARQTNQHRNQRIVSDSVYLDLDAIIRFDYNILGVYSKQTHSTKSQPFRSMYFLVTIQNASCTTQNAVTNFMYATSLYKRRWMNFKQFWLFRNINVLQKKTSIFFSCKFHLSRIFHSLLASTILTRSSFQSDLVFFPFLSNKWEKSILYTPFFAHFVSLYNERRSYRTHTYTKLRISERWITSKACICHQIWKLCGNFHFSSDQSWVIFFICKYCI